MSSVVQGLVKVEVIRRSRTSLVKLDLEFTGKVPPELGEVRREDDQKIPPLCHVANKILRAEVRRESYGGWIPRISRSGRWNYVHVVAVKMAHI